MIVFLFYVMVICFAIMSLIVLALFYAAFWFVAIVVGLCVIVYRLARGQRGEQLWRDPFSRRLREKRTSQAACSNRR